MIKGENTKIKCLYFYAKSQRRNFKEELIQKYIFSPSKGHSCQKGFDLQSMIQSHEAPVNN